jgi:hypothetical protein
MTSWLCAPRDGKPTEHATEGEAMKAADEWARSGVMAVVWPVEVDES